MMFKRLVEWMSRVFQIKRKRQGRVDQTLKGITTTIRVDTIPTPTPVRLPTPLSPLTLNASGRVFIQSNLNKTLSSLSLSSLGLLNRVGSLSKTLSPLSLSSTAFTSAARIANLSKSLSPLTLSSSSKLRIKGQTAKTLGSLSRSSTAKLYLKATLSKTLSSVSLSAIGSAASIQYDTSVGNGVDSLGFANLPLKAGGTDGPDLASGAPTSGSASYNASTRTFSTGFTLVAPARWNGILTVGQTYRLYLYYNQTDGDLVIRDENGNIQLTVRAPDDAVNEGVFDGTFVATGTDLVFSWTAGGFGGKVRMGKVCTNSGGVPAHRFFVRPGVGNDSVDGFDAQNSATPLATIAQAKKYVALGRGDQIMVAEGSTITTLPNLLSKANGFSAVYPTVLQSYDPADPTNEAKYGRAYQRSAWIKVTDPSNSGWGGPWGLNYFAIRGFEFGNGNLPDQYWSLTPSTPYNYLLIEGNRFMYCALVHDGSSIDSTNRAAWGVGHIVRNNVILGAWTTNENLQGPSNLFWHVGHLTYEDNINIHAGWKVGVSRDAQVAVGGMIRADGTSLANRRHPTYFTCSTSVVNRRNWHADGAGDDGSNRGDQTYSHNLTTDCPTAIVFGGGDSQDIKRPDGRMVTAYQSAAIGCVNVISTTQLGYGFVAENTQNGSQITECLLARGQPSGGNSCAFAPEALYNQPTYIYYNGNVAYDWTLAGRAYQQQTAGKGIYPAQVFDTYGTNWTDNVTGDPSGVGNVNNSAITMPNKYANSDALAVACGFTDIAAMKDYAIAYPVVHIQRTALTTLRTGYGMTTNIT